MHMIMQNTQQYISYLDLLCNRASRVKGSGVETGNRHGHIVRQITTDKCMHRTAQNFSGSVVRFWNRKSSTTNYRRVCLTAALK